MTETVRVRLTASERAALAAAAETAALTVSEYIRRRSLGRRVVAPRALIDVQTLNELRRLGGLIKHLATTGHGAPDDLREALTELREAAAALAALCS